jgi:hypothetical protein
MGHPQLVAVLDRLGDRTKRVPASAPAVPSSTHPGSSFSAS